MAIPGLSIGRATDADLDGIMALQEANQPERGGMLSASLPRSRVAAMIRERPLIVARRGGRIVAFLLNSARAMNGDVAIIRAMLEAYPGMVDALAQTMFTELRRMEQGVRAFCSSAVTIRHRCVPTRRWACGRWPALSSAGRTTSFSRTSARRLRRGNRPPIDAAGGSIGPFHPFQGSPFLPS